MPKTVAPSFNKKRILEASKELFYRHGIKSITIDDISRSIGMSKRTIYETYPDKDFIVDLLTEHEIEEQVMEMESIRKKSQNAIDEIFLIMDCSARNISKMNPNLMFDLQKYHPEAWKKFRSFKEEKLLGFIEDNLRQGIRQELYRKNLQIKILARLRLEEVELGFDPRVFPMHQFKMQEIQYAMLEHFMYGITTVKGHKLINKFKQITEDE